MTLGENNRDTCKGCKFIWPWEEIVHNVEKRLLYGPWKKYSQALGKNGVFCIAG